MITILVILIASLALLGVILVFIKGTGALPARDPEQYPFEARAPLNDREMALYWRLRRMLPDDIILAQVGLSRILRVRSGHDFRVWFKRINRMTIDFLICRGDGSIVAAIELDDAPHGAAEQQLADERKTKALASAGIELLRFREMPGDAELRAALG